MKHQNLGCVGIYLNPPSMQKYQVKTASSGLLDKKKGNENIYTGTIEKLNKNDPGRGKN